MGISKFRALKEQTSELAALNERMNLVLEAVPSALLMVNRDGRITLANAYAENVFGYPRAELIGQPIEMLVPERCRDIHPQHRSRFFDVPCVMAMGASRDLYGLRKDGREVPVEIGLSPVVTSVESFVLASVTDISERKSAEIDMARFTAIVSSSEDAIVSKTLDGVVTSWNEAAERLFGYSEQEMVGSTIVRIIPPDRLDEEPEILKRIRTGKRIEHFETVRVKKDGTLVNILATISPIRDALGQIIGISKIVHDISKRKQAEAQLLMAKEAAEAATLRLELATRSAGIGVWDWNVEENELLWDDEMYRLYGITGDQFGGAYEAWLQGVHPDDKSSGDEAIRLALSGQKEFNIEFRVVWPSGDVRILKANAMVLRGPSGKPQRMIGVNRDITSIKAAESAMIQAKEAAEAATLAKSDFLANMSHEIRTPMNAILGMLYLAMKSEMPPILHNYLSKAQSAANSLLGIINDILDFSKIEAGKLEIESIEFGLDTVLEQLSDAIGIQAERKGLEFLIRHDVNIPQRLIGDPLRLGQVLLNLCSNAVKFTEAGEVELSFTGRSAGETRIILEICVRDTGIGMSHEIQNILFHKFTQADQTTTRRFGGTGLGLAISKLLVEMMGGQIRIESSQSGVGTTVCFTLPLTIPGQTQGVRRDLLGQAGPQLKGIRALVVDDNEAARDILAEMLRSFQLDVSVAVSGKAAIDQLKAAADKPFEVVMMDWSMPVMNGDEATRLILADRDISYNPKVVMVTAYGREEVMKLADQAGADGFLVKPVAPSTLLDTILSVLGRSLLFGADKIKSAADSVVNGCNFAGIHLLLVEDNEINREFAVELLHSVGITLDEALNGEEAVAMVQQRHYDGVLMDIQMPVMDGLEASRRIRALAQQPGGEHFSSLPIIAMTAMAMTEDAEKCQQAGMNDYVTKPVAPERFMLTLAKWLPVKKVSSITPTETAHPDAGAAQIPADLLALITLDAEQGIRRIGGKAEAYRKQLFRFREHYSGAVDKLQRTITENGLSAGEEYCHAIKGVCGNLSANQLYACVTELDGLLKRGQMPDPEQFEIMCRLLQKTISEIDGLANPVAISAGGAAVLGCDELRAKLIALESLLKNDLGAAELLLVELRNGVTATETVEAMSRIAALMDRFAIDEALFEIAALNRRLGETV